MVMLMRVQIFGVDWWCSLRVRNQKRMRMAVDKAMNTLEKVAMREDKRTTRRPCCSLKNEDEWAILSAYHV